MTGFPIPKQLTKSSLSATNSYLFALKNIR